MRDFDPKEFEPLGIILRVPVRRRKHILDGMDPATAGMRPKPKPGGGGGGGGGAVRRMVAKAPEVMVKVSGGARGQKHLREHLSYITRNGELVAESPAGDVAGRGEVHQVAGAWWANRGESHSRANSRETVNLVLSMPPGTDRDKLMQASRLFASRTFAANHDYLLVEHRDTNHPHIHLTVRALGHDMQRLNPKKADLQMWREGLALELRGQGVLAEATPRRARGVVQKGQRQAVRHANLRGVSRVQRAKVDEAVREMTRRVAAGERPWEQATGWRQKQIRQAWGKLAAQYDAEGGEGVAMAQAIREFVSQMPPVETERQVIRRQVAQAMQERAGQGGGGGKQRDDAPER